MTCPECQIAYDPEHWDCCPHCGAKHEFSGAVQLSGVVRTSTILIAAGHGEPEVYRSVEDVPEPLRRLLVSSTSGLNSGTIYIADQGGREQITRSLQQSHAATGETAALNRPPSPSAAPPDRPVKRAVSLSTLWLALAVAGFSGAVAWLAGSRSW